MIINVATHADVQEQGPPLAHANNQPFSSALHPTDFLAAKLLELRDRHIEAPWLTQAEVAQLLDVPGIGPKTFAKLQPYIAL
jgi:hypothetical protein